MNPSGKHSLLFPEPSAPADARTHRGDPVLSAGTLLNDYEIRQVLGVGGTSVVYSAVQVSTQRLVAIKIPLKRLIDNEQFMRRFDSEGEALGALTHPNIVNILKRGSVDGTPYLVTQFVDGVSLEQAIKRRQLGYGDYLKIIQQVRDALNYIHSNGIVHLDLKPANILLSRKGRVKVADFGIAAMAWNPTAEVALDEPTLGTPGFMAPEQLLRAAVLDSRADIFSLAVTYHVMLCGRFPEQGQSQASQLSDTVPKAVDKVLGKALALAPSIRYATIDEFSYDLLHAMIGSADFRHIESFQSDSPFGFDRVILDPPTQGRVDEAVQDQQEVVELELVETGSDKDADLNTALTVQGLEAPAPIVSAKSVNLPVPVKVSRMPLVVAGLIVCTAFLAVFLLWPYFASVRNKDRENPATVSPSPEPTANSSRNAPPSLTAVVPTQPAASTHGWEMLAKLPVPKHSYSFIALSTGGDLALTTFNNRPLGSLPEELPVLLVKNALSPNPQPFVLCAYEFVSQRGYSGAAFDANGGLFLSADGGTPDSSFVARYTSEGKVDLGFGSEGISRLKSRCHGIAVHGENLFVSTDNGEVRVLKTTNGALLGTLPKLPGEAIVRDLVIDRQSGSIYGVRNGSIVVWVPSSPNDINWGAYQPSVVVPPDTLPPRSLEGLTWNESLKRVLFVPYKTTAIVEAAMDSAIISTPISGELKGAVFADTALSPDGNMLFLSDVARMQLWLAKRRQ